MSIVKNFKDRDFLKAQDDLVILDVRYDMNDGQYGRRAYEKSHAKGAGFLDMDKDLASPVEEHGGRHPLPDIVALQTTLRKLGLDNDSRVLIYDDGDNSAAGRLWWMLKYYGLEHVHVLQGGFGSLLPEDLTDREETFSQGSVELRPDASMTASYEEVLAFSKEKSPGQKILVDSRSEERYRGLVEPVDRKKGHIRNAVNIFFRSHFDEQGRIRESALEENFRSILPYDDVIFHCGSGVTACTNIMAFDELGRKSRLYVGSFSDFVSYEENTVERD